MKLKKWALLAEIVSAFAVVISLVFLAFQVREGASQTALNTKAIRSATLQDYFRQHSDLTLLPTLHPDHQVALLNARKGLEQLSWQDSEIFFPYAVQRIRGFFVGYQMMQSGLLPEEDWLTFERALSRFLNRNVGFVDIWEMRRDDYPADFQELVDGMVESSEDE